MDPTVRMVDRAVAVLTNLAAISEGRATISQEGGIPVLVEVVKLGSAIAKDNVAAALSCATVTIGFATWSFRRALSTIGCFVIVRYPKSQEKGSATLGFFRNQQHGNGGRK